MLISLAIQHYVIIDELLLDFSQGMTVLSGETGAGKSIIIDALILALGGRGDAQVVAPNQKRCDISATFDVVLNTDAYIWLNAQELLSDGENICIFHRIIHADGRTRATINGRAFPLQKVRELAQYFVDIHGQHDHQLLLKTDTHRMQLDTYVATIGIEHVHMLQETAHTYRHWKKAQETLKSMTQDVNHEARVSLLQYQYEELEQAHLQENEAACLQEEQEKLSHASENLEHMQTIYELLNSETESSARSLLNRALSVLPKSTKNLQTLLNQACLYTDEAIAEAKLLLETFELNPERLLEVEARLQILHQLARKHHTTMEELPRLCVQMAKELHTLQHFKDNLLKQEAECQKAKNDYLKAALTLSQNRKKHAPNLCVAIQKELHHLGMTHAKIELQFNEAAASVTGNEKIEYYLTTHPTLPLRPLNKVASGGELSRMSLAIEVVTTQKNSQVMRIFDEVDVGIGGKTAAVVGRLLRQLGEASQVICITHQPQTAACGHHHLYVVKTLSNYSVLPIQDKVRIQEIARMLGGLEITEHTLANAQDLLLSTR